MPISDCFKAIQARYGEAVPANTLNTLKTPMCKKDGSEYIQLEQLVRIHKTPLTPKTPALDEYWQERFEERAAILEFEGELPRHEAEHQAKKMIEEERHEQNITFH